MTFNIFVQRTLFLLWIKTVKPTEVSKLAAFFLILPSRMKYTPHTQISNGQQFNLWHTLDNYLELVNWQRIWELLVFRRKDLCEARSKTPTVFCTKSMEPPCTWGFGSGWHFCQIFRSGWPLVRWTPLGGAKCYYCTQVDLWSDVPPRQRHLVAKCVTISVRLISGQMDPPGDALGWVDIFQIFGSGWPLVRWTPPQETSCGQVLLFGQVSFG